MIGEATSVVGTQPEHVIKLLQSRVRQGTDARQMDGRKLGLVVEGGGMRGVLSAGSLLAVDLLGFRSCFDVVYAVSAGSVNAAYFLSGQGRLGITVYFDDISSRRFINPWRAWKMVDVDYVYDHLVPQVKPLDEAAIRRSLQEFFVTATDVHTGENVLLDAKDPTVSVARFLKASSALPILYNRKVVISGKSYMDGGVSGGLPIDWAIAQGCTDLLVLLSRPSTYMNEGPNLFERWLFRVFLGLKYPAMYRGFVKASSVKERNRRLAVGIESSPGVNIATICPDPEEDSINRTTIDRAKLLKGAYLSAAKVFDCFYGDRVVLNNIFEQFRKP